MIEITDEILEEVSKKYNLPKEELAKHLEEYNVDIIAEKTIATQNEYGANYHVMAKRSHGGVEELPDYVLLSFAGTNVPGSIKQISQIFTLEEAKAIHSALGEVLKDQ